MTFPYLIEKAGIKPAKIADAIGLDRSTFYKKMTEKPIGATGRVYQFSEHEKAQITDWLTDTVNNIDEFLDSL